MPKITSGRFALIGAAMLAVVSPALAHHAVNAQFDPNAEVAMTGTLKTFDNRAPHAYWTFVDQKTGQEWRFESVSPASLRRAGIKLKDDIVPGKQFSFVFAPARDTTSHTGLMRGIDINGKRVNFMPDYIDLPDAPKS